MQSKASHAKRLLFPGFGLVCVKYLDCLDLFSGAMKVILRAQRVSGCRTLRRGWSNNRKSSSVSSPVLRRDIAAPHCGSIRILSLDNPATRNAISRHLLSELRNNVHEIMKEGAEGQTRALILASNVDSSFCAGADLKERAQFSPSE